MSREISPGGFRALFALGILIQHFSDSLFSTTGDNGHVMNTGHFKFILSDVQTSYHEISNQCTRLHTTVLNISDSNEYLNVVNILAATRYEYVEIWLTAFFAHNKYFWTSGKYIDYNYFISKDGEPDYDSTKCPQGTDGTCLLLTKINRFFEIQQNHQLIDDCCGLEKHFMCSYRTGHPNSSPATPVLSFLPDTSELECYTEDISSNTFLTYRWRKDGALFKEASGYGGVGSTLQITINPLEEHEYRCAVVSSYKVVSMLSNRIVDSSLITAPSTSMTTVSMSPTEGPGSDALSWQSYPNSSNQDSNQGSIGIASDQLPSPSPLYTANEEITADSIQETANSLAMLSSTQYIGSTLSSQQHIFYNDSFDVSPANESTAGAQSTSTQTVSGTAQTQHSNLVNDDDVVGSGSHTSSNGGTTGQHQNEPLDSGVQESQSGMNDTTVYSSSEPIIPNDYEVQSSTERHTELNQTVFLFQSPSSPDVNSESKMTAESAIATNTPFSDASSRADQFEDDCFDSRGYNANQTLTVFFTHITDAVLKANLTCWLGANQSVTWYVWKINGTFLSYGSKHLIVMSNETDAEGIYRCAFFNQGIDRYSYSNIVSVFFEHGDTAGEVPPSGCANSGVPVASPHTQQVVESHNDFTGNSFPTLYLQPSSVFDQGEQFSGNWPSPPWPATDSHPAPPGMSPTSTTTLSTPGPSTGPPTASTPRVGLEAPVIRSTFTSVYTGYSVKLACISRETDIVKYFFTKLDGPTPSGNTTQTSIIYQGLHNVLTISNINLRQQGRYACFYTTADNNQSDPSNYLNLRVLSDFSLCSCPCNASALLFSVSSDYVDKIRSKITETLFLPKDNLSSKLRRKISAEDSRSSSTGVGVVAIVFMSFVIVMVVAVDGSVMLVYGWTAIRKTTQPQIQL